MKPVIMRMVVDLPAPLGPRKPSTSPRSTVNEMSSTARLRSKVLTRFSILIMFEGRNYRSSSAPQIMRILAFVAAALLSLQAFAQSYPAKPVRIIVPFAPGGGSDFIARFAAQRLSAAFGSQVIVENRPGAGGMLGIDLGVKADPDGHTLTLIASSYTVNPALYPLKYDPVGDITAGGADLAGADDPGRQPEAAGAKRRRADRARESQARPAQLRFRRAGQHHAHGLRAVRSTWPGSS